jgi:Nuclease-related domain
MIRMIILIEKLSWLLPLVLLFGILVLMLATLQRILVEIRLKADARYLNITVLRSPGESTRRRIDRTNGEIGAFAVALGTIPLTLYAALLSYVHFLFLDLSWMDTCYFGAISASFILYGLNKIKRLKARKHRLYLTYEGQMAVAQEVNRLMPEGYQVFHDFPTDRFHIDHIIVGPNGVFTVTTKVISPFSQHREKSLTVDDQRLIVGKKSDDRTIPFATFQASWLAKWLLTATGEALSVQSILTVPGWRMKILRKTSILAVEPGAIKEAVNGFRWHQISRKTIRSVCEQLEIKCRKSPAQ